MSSWQASSFLSCSETDNITACPGDKGFWGNKGPKYGTEIIDAFRNHFFSSYSEAEMDRSHREGPSWTWSFLLPVPLCLAAVGSVLIVTSAKKVEIKIWNSLLNQCLHMFFQGNNVVLFFLTFFFNVLCFRY